MLLFWYLLVLHLGSFTVFLCCLVLTLAVDFVNIGFSLFKFFTANLVHNLTRLDASVSVQNKLQACKYVV